MAKTQDNTTAEDKGELDVMPGADPISEEDVKPFEVDMNFETPEEDEEEAQEEADENVEVEEETLEEPEEDEEEETLELVLRVASKVGGLVDLTRQEETLRKLNPEPLLIPYYMVEYQGLIDYPDKHSMQDKVLPDNNRAMRQLAGDAKHYSMVRSKYDRE